MVSRGIPMIPKAAGVMKGFHLFMRQRRGRQRDQRRVRRSRDAPSPSPPTAFAVLPAGRQQGNGVRKGEGNTPEPSSIPIDSTPLTSGDNAAMESFTADRSRKNRIRRET
jgi:hypothetical protein